MSFAANCYTTATYINFKGHIAGEPTKFVSKTKTCALVEAIIEQESNFNPKAFNPEKTGSYGLMQVQCDTARRLGMKGNCSQLFDSYNNMYYGLQLLLHLEKRYSLITDIVAAYNAGRVIKNNGQYINELYVKSVMGKYLKKLPKNYVGANNGVL